MRDQFATWSGIRARAGVRLGIPDVSYYAEKVDTGLPNVTLSRFQSVEAMFSGTAAGDLDGLVLTAERGSAWTLMHPEYRSSCRRRADQGAARLPDRAARRYARERGVVPRDRVGERHLHQAWLRHDH